MVLGVTVVGGRGGGRGRQGLCCCALALRGLHLRCSRGSERMGLELRSAFYIDVRLVSLCSPFDVMLSVLY